MAMPASQVTRTADDGIERQDVLDVVGSRLQQAIGSAFAAGGTAGRRVRDFLHGTWLGHPLHPALIDVPLGAWTTALVLDTLAGRKRNGFARAADSAIALGLAGGVAAAITGLTDWHHTEGGDRRRGLTHGLLNLGAMTIYATALTLRRRGARGPGRLLAALGFLTAGTAGYLGGDLVYRRRIGVDHGARETWDSFVAVLPYRDLQDGHPRRVEARGVSIVLLRRGGRVYALGEQCAHLGGPLSEGRVDGDGIRCPWHGSLFSLEDGRVLEGPSAYRQPCFDVRIRGESIEVRPRN